MALRIGVINQKGGVGKTTISNALAYEFANQLGLKTLLIDFDPQASQTILMNLNPDDFLDSDQPNISKIFEKEMIEPINIIPNLDFIPSNTQLSRQSEKAVVGKDKMLEKFLKKIESNYDVIIIDSNPSFSSLMTNVVLASNILVVPIGTSALDEAGTHGFFQIIEEIADVYEKIPEKIFVIPTKFDKRRRDDREVLSIFKNELPLYIKTLDNLQETEFEVLNPIPERAVIKDASASRMFLKEYIETYEKAQREVGLIFEEIAQKLIQEVAK